MLVHRRDIPTATGPTPNPHGQSTQSVLIGALRYCPPAIGRTRLGTHVPIPPHGCLGLWAHRPSAATLVSRHPHGPQGQGYPPWGLRPRCIRVGPGHPVPAIAPGIWRSTVGAHVRFRLWPPLRSPVKVSRFGGRFVIGCHPPLPARSQAPRLFCGGNIGLAKCLTCLGPCCGVVGLFGFGAPHLSFGPSRCLVCGPGPLQAVLAPLALFLFDFFDFCVFFWASFVSGFVLLPALGALGLLELNLSFFA